MNNLTVVNNTPETDATLTSKEIAELTGKQHKNVLKDLRKQFEELGIGQLQFEQSYVNSQNKEQPMFKLPKDQVMILLTGYSIPLRAKVIARLNELENKQPQLPVMPEMQMIHLISKEAVRTGARLTKVENILNVIVNDNAKLTQQIEYMDSYLPELSMGEMLDSKTQKLKYTKPVLKTKVVKRRVRRVHHYIPLTAVIMELNKLEKPAKDILSILGLQEKGSTRTLRSFITKNL